MCEERQGLGGGGIESAWTSGIGFDSESLEEEAHTSSNTRSNGPD